MTEKILRKMIAFVIAAAFILPLMMPQVFAASTVNIVTKDNIKGGETFTVTVTFGEGDVSRVDAQLTYDLDMIKYISGGTSTGDTGFVDLTKAGTDGSVVFNLEFQAITEGNVILDVTTNAIYDFSEQPMDNPSASKSITIEGNAAADDIVETTAPDEDAIEEMEDPAQQPVVLEGVDEKYGPKITTIAIIAAVILLLLIIIISIALKKSKKPKNRKGAAIKAAGAATASDEGFNVPAADIDDPASGDRYEASLEGPNPLRNYKNPYETDKDLEEELQRRREEIRQRRYEQRMAAREYAKAQTQIWDEWTLDDDDKRDTDDIEKW